MLVCWYDMLQEVQTITEAISVNVADWFTYVMSRTELQHSLQGREQPGD